MIYDSSGYVGIDTLNQFLEGINNKFLKILDFHVKKIWGFFQKVGTEL